MSREESRLGCIRLYRILCSAGVLDSENPLDVLDRAYRVQSVLKHASVTIGLAIVEMLAPEAMETAVVVSPDRAGRGAAKFADS